MASYLFRPFLRFIRNPIELFKPMNIEIHRNSYIAGNFIRQYYVKDLEKMKANFTSANKDILGKMNEAEFNNFIGLSTGRRWTTPNLNQVATHFNYQ